VSVAPPRVLLARDAARRIFHEVQRWVEEGLRHHGAPLECIAYPLSALIPRGGTRCPLELLALEDLRQVIIDQVAIPPDDVKAFSPANCHFDLRGDADANARFNAEIDALVRRRPRLAVNSKLHSHPFSASPFLSGGDLHHGVTSTKARRWRWRRGLDTALLHLAYPDGEPALVEGPWRLTDDGALAGGRGEQKVRWRLRSWGSGPDGEMVDLGDALVVSAGHTLVRAARRLPYWQTRKGGAWCDRQKAALRGAGFPVVSRNLLGRGWRRYLVGDGRRHILVALPPDLPQAPPRVLEVVDAAKDLFEVLALPSWFKGGSLGKISLVELVRHYLETRIPR